jgi:hypothetical protein
MGSQTSDYGERPFVQEEGPSQHARVAAEAALPDAVVQDCGARTTGQILGAVESAAQNGRRAEDLEELPGDMQALQLNGRIAGAQRLVDPRLIVERGSREYVVGTPRHVLGNGDRGVVAAVRKGFAQAHQTVRLPKRERLKDHPVDHGEDGGVGSDPQREGGDSHRCESRIAAHGAEGVTDVGRESGHVDTYVWQRGKFGENYRKSSR